MDTESAIEETVQAVGAFQAWWESVRVLLISKGIQVVIAIIIFLIGRKVIHMLMRLFDRVAEKSKTEPTVRSFGRNALKACMYVILVLIILVVVGYEITSLATIIASAGVVVGLALQGSLSNLAGGILILLMKPFGVGDFISAAGYSGTVTEIGLIYTTMITVDNHKVVVPNSTLSGASLENFSTAQTRRVDVQVGIAYEADLREAKKVFRQVIESMPEYLADQPVDVFVAELGDSAVTLEGRMWVKAENYWTALWSLRENIKLAYDEKGIKIPYTQVEIHQA